MSINVSDPSTAIDVVNVPEVKDVIAEFVYNFHEKSERLLPPTSPDSSPLNRTSRYTTVRWTAPTLTEFEESKQDLTNRPGVDNLTIESNVDKIVSEDNFFNPDFITHTFSSSEVVEQGATDLEIFSRMNQTSAESLAKIARSQLAATAEVVDGNDPIALSHLNSLASTYTKLADMPKDALGLRVFDETGRPSDDDDLIRSISDTVSLTVSLNNAVIPDFFKNSTVKSNTANLQALKKAYVDNISVTRTTDGIVIRPVRNDVGVQYQSYSTQPVKIVGYIVDRYVSKTDGFVKEKTFYVEKPTTTSIVDRTILYGHTYIYAVRVVASVKLLTFGPDGTRVDMSEAYVCSRPSTAPIECYEYVPPPEPTDLKFVFDYTQRNLIIQWDMPVNPQRDVKQFQVFRRKSIYAPFELIAQYGFDDTDPGQPDNSRYKTGEEVDANNIEDMRPDYRSLVTVLPPGRSNYVYRDREFTVDEEALEASSFIYAVCSVDAHGMISNYSAQHSVSFDVFKNRIVSRIVCDAGSPRPYPNMRLRVDAFKDVIRVAGTESKQMRIHFTPEFLKVRDDSGAKFDVVEAVIPSSNDTPYYVMQFINLDNQKTQQLRIDILDPEGLTK